MTQPPISELQVPTQSWLGRLPAPSPTQPTERAGNFDANTAADMVNHPPHYRTESGMEAIAVIEAFELNYRLGNAVKYLLRAGKKGDKAEDIAKARWYLDRELKALDKGSNNL